MAKIIVVSVHSNTQLVRDVVNVRNLDARVLKHCQSHDLSCSVFVRRRGRRRTGPQGDPQAHRQGESVGTHTHTHTHLHHEQDIKLRDRRLE